MSTELRSSLFFCVGLVVLHLFGLLFPGPLNWGFHFFGFLPWHTAVIYFAAAAWIVIFILKGKPEELIEAAGRSIERFPIQFLLATLVVLVSFAFLLRVQAPLLGDSFYLLKNYSQAAQGIAPLYPRDEPLATYYFSFILRILGGTSYSQYLTGFFIADLILGIIFIITTFVIAATLWKAPQHRALAFCFLLFLPYNQLFLGYVETYSVVLCVLSLYVCAAVRYLDGKLPFPFVPAAFLLMALSHYLSSLLFLSLLYLSFLELKKGNVKQLVYGYGIVFVSLIVLLRIVDFDIQRFTSWVPYSHFLSYRVSSDPMENYAQAYTLFSGYHLIDLLNLLLLLGAIPIYMTTKELGERKKKLAISPPITFLVLALIPVALFLSFVKFDLGAARDWDVFSPYAFLLGLLAATMFFKSIELPAIRTYALLVAFTFLNSIFFYYVNSDAESSVMRFKALFDQRTLSQNGFYGGSLQLSMYYHEIHNTAEPVRLWQTYTDLYPEDNRGYQNIINNLSPDRHEREIDRTFERWYIHNPDNEEMLKAFKRYSFGNGNSYFLNGNLEKAAIYFQIALRLDSSDANSWNNFGSVLAEQKKLDKALEMFAGALAIDSSYADALHNIGDAYIDSGAKNKGYDFLRRAARLGHEEARRDLTQAKLNW